MSILPGCAGNAFLRRSLSPHHLLYKKRNACKKWCAVKLALLTLSLSGRSLPCRMFMFDCETI